MSSDHPTYPTSLGVSDLHTISLMGQDLSADLIGKVSFGHLAYRLITLQEPTEGQARVFEAVLVALADHGFTPTAISARMTYLSAPESIQGALASGLLGGGSRFLGVSEDTGRFLADALAGVEELPTTTEGWDELAADAVRRQRAAGRFVPGLGHHLHKQGDPRIAALYGVAHEAGQVGPHLALFEAVGRVAEEVTGKALPLNGAGACGAALADIGIPVELLRGVVLLARCAGLLGHIAEEVRGNHVAADVFADVERHAVYVDPPAPARGEA
ncbi:citryl-CoA lyase [Nocardioides abyssi]|uniref:citrate synthase (unknown stereospecificity) n=1 Tax=Nocardioides abyssi TaxID=3058370 RepID=A0ABT8EYV4_9ACTN|nr:citryl-CoA lyase [Nocardioides abyssi]MDN4163381.1 citryl-CoA lyase [Nocardioides abyssi]